MKRIFFLFAITCTLQLHAQTSTTRMNTFINGLMKKMTLDEKLGQMNLPGAADIVFPRSVSSPNGTEIIVVVGGDTDHGNIFHREHCELREKTLSTLW